MTEFLDMLFSFVHAYLASKYRWHASYQAKVDAHQNKMLKQHLRWVSTHSPFYKDIQSLQSTQLSSFPIINKKIMMANFDRLNTVGLKKAECFDVALKSETSRNFSPEINGFSVGMSSGTSGSRGLFVASKKEQAAWAGAIMAKALPGSIFGSHRVALFLRANNNLYENLGSKRIQFKFFDLINDPQQNIQELLRFRPTILAAPPSMLRMIVEAGSRQPRNNSTWAPQRIFSIAEVLDPVDEPYLSNGFQQPIHQIYQATEGFLAISCKQGSIHLNEDAVYFEKKYLDGQHFDAEKRRFMPIITDFRRKTQPIIRYELNDILIESNHPCPCGSAMTRIEAIEGRCDDLFKFPSISGSNTIEVFPDFIRRAIIQASDDISEYAAIQTTPHQIAIHSDLPPSSRSKIQLNLQSLAKSQGFRAPNILFSQTMPPRDRLDKLKRIRCNI